MQDKGIENLRYAIVANAVRDYVMALHRLRKAQYDQTSYEKNEAEKLKNDCERFFRSAWFSVLCNLDGKELMETVKQRSYNGKIQGLSW